ncbi:MAG: YeeE/YedE thiosulfate transporter family protein [Pseudomonadota bacterium]
MLTIAFPILVLAVAFIIGYTIRRGSICVVAATQAFVVQRRSKRLRAFGVAVAAAGLVIIPLHWIAPDHVSLSVSYPASLTAVFAGAAYAIGARINNACAFGTLAHLTGGRLAYAMTLVGAALGVSAVLVYVPVMAFHDNPSMSLLDEPSLFSLAVLLLFFGVLALTIIRRGQVWWQDLRSPEIDRLGPFRAMMIIGTLSGVLYAIIRGWTHMDLLSRNAALFVGQTVPKNETLLLLSAAALFVGGLSAALRSGQFKIRLPMLGEFGRCLVGGSVMGASAAIIPGGNGILLVHGVPSVAPNALAAYAAMTLILCGTFLGQRKNPS